jgi:phosphate transport system substrate-binding protein
MSAITDKNNKPIPIIFSVDALAIITDYKVGLDSLSSNQITNIFNGTIKNRKEFGGDEKPIRLFERYQSSGTRNYFSSKFLVKDSSSGIKVCSSNDEIVHLVSQTHGAVGYAGAGLLYDKHGKPNDTNWTMQIYINHQRAISP